MHSPFPRAPLLPRRSELRYLTIFRRPFRARLIGCVHYTGVAPLRAPPPACDLTPLRGLFGETTMAQTQGLRPCGLHRLPVVFRPFRACPMQTFLTGLAGDDALGTARGLPFANIPLAGAQRGRLQLRYLAAVAQGEGVFLTVFALHAAVSQPNVEGALDGARILEGAGVEDRYGLFGVA